MEELAAAIRELAEAIREHTAEAHQERTSYLQMLPETEGLTLATPVESQVGSIVGEGLDLR